MRRCWRGWRLGGTERSCSRACRARGRRQATTTQGVGSKYGGIFSMGRADVRGATWGGRSEWASRRRRHVAHSAGCQDRQCSEGCAGRLAGVRGAYTQVACVGSVAIGARRAYFVEHLVYAHLMEIADGICRARVRADCAATWPHTAHRAPTS